MSDTINKFIWRRKKEQNVSVSRGRGYWLMSECAKNNKKGTKKKKKF